MPLRVKISDRLIALARNEAAAAHRSTTAQIEHWATLGRAVEAIIAHRDILALKRLGQTLPIPIRTKATPDDVHALLMSVVADPDHESVKARIPADRHTAYTTDPPYPGMVVEVQPDGTRRPGVLNDREFIAAPPRRAGRRTPTRRSTRNRAGG